MISRPFLMRLGYLQNMNILDLAPSGDSTCWSYLQLDQVVSPGSVERYWPSEATAWFPLDNFALQCFAFKSFPPGRNLLPSSSAVAALVYILWCLCRLQHFTSRWINKVKILSLRRTKLNFSSLTCWSEPHRHKRGRQWWARQEQGWVRPRCRPRQRGTLSGPSSASPPGSRCSRPSRYQCRCFVLMFSLSTPAF